MHRFQNIVRQKKSVNIQNLRHDQKTQVWCWAMNVIKTKQNLGLLQRDKMGFFFSYLNPGSIRPKSFFWVNNTFPLYLWRSIHDMMDRVNKKIYLKSMEIHVRYCVSPLRSAEHGWKRRPTGIPAHPHLTCIPFFSLACSSLAEATRSLLNVCNLWCLYPNLLLKFVNQLGYINSDEIFILHTSTTVLPCAISEARSVGRMFSPWRIKSLGISQSKIIEESSKQRHRWDRPPSKPF